MRISVLTHVSGAPFVLIPDENIEEAIRRSFRNFCSLGSMEMLQIWVG